MKTKKNKYLKLYFFVFGVVFYFLSFIFKYVLEQVSYVIFVLSFIFLIYFLFDKLSKKIKRGRVMKSLRFFLMFPSAFLAYLLFNASYAADISNGSAWVIWGFFITGFIFLVVFLVCGFSLMGEFAFKFFIKRKG